MGLKREITKSFFKQRRNPPDKKALFHNYGFCLFARAKTVEISQSAGPVKRHLRIVSRGILKCFTYSF